MAVQMRATRASGLHAGYAYSSIAFDDRTNSSWPVAGIDAIRLSGR